MIFSNLCRFAKIVPVFCGLLEAKDLSPQRFCEEASLGLESFISGVLKQDYEGIENVSGRLKCTTSGRINRVQNVPPLRDENGST